VLISRGDLKLNLLSRRAIQCTLMKRRSESPPPEGGWSLWRRLRLKPRRQTHVTSIGRCGAHVDEPSKDDLDVATKGLSHVPSSSQ
jgi:hypothetical protein